MSEEMKEIECKKCKEMEKNLAWSGEPPKCREHSKNKSKVYDSTTSFWGKC